NSHDGSSLIVVLKKSSAGQQHADTAHPLALLRPRRKRPGSCAAEQRDELATFSLDHLVGEREQRGRNGEADRLSGWHVDDKLYLCRKLYRQIARLFAFQNPVHEVGGAAEVLAQIDAIADQTAILDVLTEIKDCVQP